MPVYAYVYRYQLSTLIQTWPFLEFVKNDATAL